MRSDAQLYIGVPALCSRAMRFSPIFCFVLLTYASITEGNLYVHEIVRTGQFFFKELSGCGRHQPSDWFQACRPHGWSHACGTGKPRPLAAAFQVGFSVEYLAVVRWFAKLVKLYLPFYIKR